MTFSEKEHAPHLSRTAVGASSLAEERRRRRDSSATGAENADLRESEGKKERESGASERERERKSTSGEEEKWRSTRVSGLSLSLWV